ncbi:copper ABC transporter ATP-binding protein NosF (plasmid) [Rhizobium etli 8C-3]|uniref:Copper ABC transporter ATP-binding protein NosF n=1 Tax=Rhizobium etli 8C-3 TaxID=538025 RepID=A0A1L5PF65_RHIET|nr:ABC transporter ATP-binding protein [Rhizobium etli]APO78783.1 copper ABC transporter ATP-binding protein NosF [Rhizobium etli 8C-3]
MTPSVCLMETSKSYGKFAAVNDISLSLGEGETIALVGHNGAGKTTIIKLILGLIRPTSGKVRVLGEDPVTGNTGVRRRLGYLPESVSFHLALTGREILTFYARLKRIRLAKTHDLFDRVGLAESADRQVRTYSKGMRQRLGLAQALLGEPRILLLDEPTSGLDPALRRNFYDLVSELRAKGTTVLLSSHALTELEDRADRVIIVNGGLKIADGTLEDLRQIARLPTRIRFKPSQDAGADHWATGYFPWTRSADGLLEADIDHEEKIAALSCVTADPQAVANLTIMEPTLDDLYAHFLNGQGTRQ